MPRMQEFVIFFHSKLTNGKKGCTFIVMATYKYIYHEHEEYVWCKKMKSFDNDCGDDESVFVWGNWASFPPGQPWEETGPCFIYGCYPWEVDDIIYDKEGKWKVTQVSTESWALAQYFMYDCFYYAPGSNYRKFFHLDYIWTARATLMLLHGPIVSSPGFLVLASPLFGISRIPGEARGFFGIEAVKTKGKEKH